MATCTATDTFTAPPNRMKYLISSQFIAKTAMLYFNQPIFFNIKRVQYLSNTLIQFISHF